MRSQTKRGVRLFLVGALLFLGAACGGPQVSFMAPVGPEIPIHKDRSIGVAPFQTAGDVNLRGSDWALVGDADYDAQQLAQIHRAELMTAIIDHGVHGVKDAGAADVVISGRLDYSVSDDRDCREKQVQEHKKVRICIYDRRARLVVQMNARDKNGQIIETAGWTETEHHQTDYRRDLAPYTEMLDVLVTRAAYEAARRLSPHCLRVRAQLQEGDSDAIEAANEQAKNGQWKAAAKTWIEMTKGSDANRRAAHFNLGVYHERRARLKKAQTHYAACLGRSVCDRAHARVTGRIENKPSFAKIGLEDFSCSR